MHDPLSTATVSVMTQATHKAKAYFEHYQTIFFIKATLYRKFWFLWVPVKSITDSTSIWDGEEVAYQRMRELRREVAVSQGLELITAK